MSGLTELEFARMMRGLPMETETHRMILKAMLVDNPYVDGTTFALAYGAVSRVPIARLRTITQRELLREFGFPEIFVCAEPQAGDGKQGLP